MTFQMPPGALNLAALAAFLGSILSACTAPRSLNADAANYSGRPTVTTASISANELLQQRAFEATSPAGGCPWDHAIAANLTLAVAVERALCAHPRIREAKAAVSLERAQRAGAMAAFFPNVSGSVARARNISRTDTLFGPSVTDTKGRASSIIVSWLLYDFGGREAQISAATELVIAAIASHDMMLQNTFTTVADAYFTVVTNTSISAVANAAVKNARRLLEAAALRERLGAATSADREFARVGLAQAELFVSRTNEQLQLARGDLASLLNLNPDARLSLSSAFADRELTSAYFASNVGDRISSLLRTIEAHPQMRAATARAAASQAQIISARAEYLPKLSMAANYFVNGRPGASVASSRSAETYIGLSLNYPIFDGLATYHRVRAARAQHERNLAELEDTRNSVKNAIWKAHQSSMMSVQSYKAAQAVVASADAAKRQARQRYENGAGDITEWLRAEKTDIDSRIEVIRALAEIRIGRLRLMLSLGSLGPWVFDLEKRREALVD